MLAAVAARGKQGPHLEFPRRRTGRKICFPPACPPAPGRFDQWPCLRSPWGEAAGRVPLIYRLTELQEEGRRGGGPPAGGY